MKYIAIFALAITVSGCEFGRGFRDEGARQAASLAADEVERRLGDDFKEVSDGLKDFGGKMPPPSSPIGDGGLYALGALAAYIVGSVGKGYLRSRAEKKEG